MAEPARALERDDEPDVSHLVTEDDTPVESPFQDHQMRLLTHVLYASWPYPDRAFVAYSDVGLFATTTEPAVVPDVLLSLDVTEPVGSAKEKRNRSYFIWRYGKPPDVVVEIVSNDEGGEEEKLARYARMRIAYACIYDPLGFLGRRRLRVYDLRGGRYFSLPRSVRPAREKPRSQVYWMPGVGLGLTVWHGVFERRLDHWLRWCDREGQLLPTGQEAAAREREAAARAREAAARERERADRLEARLRELGHGD